ncbi:aldo/keto reductase [Saccharopolyspora phatthalungensis]|uniref:Aryl-alcohol dehydrogenase-like predicted oxidoreductase n=1 Tax=Saccharopolyspora phatthalungensis TaxID=664693 RepID=A0A840QJP8_9PSEU|nr:aldo/keto reductase [Saccharopolyspora phatthalungensis]MBB5159538.1 aryl-alcohol dehydrogenase-like predicted oxidoreductase [Saccharopolyspora phatthalungensis]
MEYRQLGRSGLRVSTLAMGTMTFAGNGILEIVGRTDADEAARQVRMAIDAGVNLFDTANAYSAGAAEDLLGKAIAGRRDEILLSTKVRMVVGPGPNDGGLSRHHIIGQLEASLRRLGTDHVDIYHVHQWDGQTPLEETLETLDTLVRSGKVRYLGVSNYAGWQLMKALAVSDARGYQRFVSNQIYYSLESRDAEYELVPLSLDQGLGILVWSPLAGGLLTGKYRRDADAPTGTRHVDERWDEPPVRDMNKLYDTIETLVGIADGHGASPAQIALAYLLKKPGVASVLIGARTQAQLRDNLGAAEVVLAEDEFAALDTISTPDLIYPHWHQATLAAERFGQPDRALHGRFQGKTTR